eukprot:Protomagalhaensia_sp_Gyna_25__5722@NODE_820_length_2552_cov_233_085157_g382_i1_p4_GENE_NODE_820_length_2552_cov_233_085157_g382_i1NODE_820_length_2552_cov_233_085157_g382_i1_p4_ORF_typecomplete_len155_score25_06_NODE_820_length_2552_cov_233_085157_g382_i120732537
MSPSTGDQDFEDDQFTVQQVDHLQVPRLSLKASKSLPYCSPPNLSKITPYEPPKSEKLRHRPELLQVEFAEGNNEETSDLEQDEETQQSTVSTSPIKQQPKKNMKVSINVCSVLEGWGVLFHGDSLFPIEGAYVPWEFLVSSDLIGFSGIGFSG